MRDPVADAAPYVQLLHTPRLVLAGGATHALERKDAALLALLAFDGAMAPARAASLMWPDTPGVQARTNLRQRLFRLRKLAASELVRTQGSLELAPGLAVDVLQFSSVLPADAGAGAGELLGDLDYSGTGELAQWVATARQRWRGQRFDLLAARASHFEGLQNIALALVLAQRMVCDEPLQEHAHRRLMRLHYLRGDRAAALAAFAGCRDALRRELGATPSRETAQLAALIEASGPLAQPAPPPRTVATLRPPRLVGRAAPWQRLEQALCSGALVLVEGEAGIGKTRLLGDFAAAHGDAPVFGARPGDAGLAYAMLARIVRGLVARFALPAADWVLPEFARIAPELGVPAAGQLSPLRLQQATVQALTEWRAAGLTMLIVEDLHHADSASLEFLPALTTGVPEPGIAWFFSARQGELPAAAVPWLHDPDTQALERIALTPFDLACVQSLVALLDLPGIDAERWAPALERHTGGNPLFLLETLIALLDRPGAYPLSGEAPQLPTPERIVRLVEQRLALLSPAALRLARMAAIAGQDFSAGLAATVLNLHALDIADSWRELEGAQVLRGDGFVHDLVFEATLRSVPQPIARLLHCGVAQALQGASAPPARLAVHWSMGQAWAAAAQAYVAAARAAFAASRRVEEAHLWDEAVLCYERAGQPDEAFDARCESIDTGLAARPAESVLVQTGALLDAARTGEQRLGALLAHGKALLTAGRRRDAVQTTDDASALAQTLGMPWQRFTAARLSALSLSPGPRAAQGIARLRTFEPIVQAEGSPVQRCDFYTDLVVAVHLADRRSEAAALYPVAINAARAVGDTSAQAISTSNLSGLLGQLGRVEDGHAWAEQACRLLERMGAPGGVSAAAALINLASFDAMLGRLDLAVRGLEDAWSRLGSQGGTAQHAACETHLANVWLQLGQPARALQSLKPIPAAVVAQVAQRQVRRLTIEARIGRALGQPALPRLEQAVQLFGPNTDPYLRMLTLLDRSRELAPGEALAECRQVQGEAHAMELLAVAMRARLFAVEALRRAGLVAQAAAEARACSALWRDCRPADLFLPEALWIAFQALRDEGDSTAAQALLSEAVAWINDTAGAHVPAPFRDGFVQRNPVNRAILVAAGCRDPR